MDRFENQIIENKDLFEQPFKNEAKLWDRINNQLDKQVATKKPISKSIIFTTCLIIVLMAISAFLFIQNSELKSNQNFAEERNKEIKDISNHYGKQISYEISLLEESKALSTDEKQEFLLYINELEQEQLVLKEVLKDNINNEEKMDALIQNFKQQIKLIHRLVVRLQKQEKNKYESGISM